MCGIIGCVGVHDAASVLASGLENLEYRGYDSAGIALRTDGIDVQKETGAVSDIDFTETAGAPAGIGHTRWSTHGKPTRSNAHPHRSCEGRVTVVHNGIIENYEELKERLSDHEFTSETDTEVIPHLLEEGLSDREPLAAFRWMVDQLEGSFAVTALVEGHDGIFATRQDSPLVLGCGDSQTFVASDVTAFLEYTDEVIYLTDGDVVHARAQDLRIYNDGQRVDRPVETVDWDAEAAQKGGYDHYMHKEIHEQPQSMQQALTGRLDERTGGVDLDVSLPDDVERVHLVACGTSYHAGLYAATLLERHAGVPTAVERAGEYSVTTADPEGTLTVAISQSGETADTLAALRRAKEADIPTLAVTNTVGSTIAREADEEIYIRAGPEIGVAATKTFVSQVATLALLTVRLGVEREVVDDTERRRLVRSLYALPQAIESVVADEDRIAGLARALGDNEGVFYIGRQLGYPVALESALKLKEISYDHAEGFMAAELKHGPLALVTSETPVIGILAEGSNPDGTVTSLREAATRGAPIVAVASEDVDASVADHVIRVPAVGVMEPLLAAVALQLFAYHVADQKGRSIDKPRNLAKSVTVD